MLGVRACMQRVAGRANMETHAGVCTEVRQHLARTRAHNCALHSQPGARQHACMASHVNGAGSESWGQSRQLGGGGTALQGADMAVGVVWCTEMAARPQPPALSPPCGAEPRPLPSVLGNSLAATAGPCGGAELQGKLTPSSPDSHAGPPPLPPPGRARRTQPPPPRLLERFLFLSIYRLNLKKK